MHDCAALRARLSACCEYLHDCGATVEGISVWGSPWSPTFCDWAFNLPRGPQIAAKWRQIPEGVGVLVTHGPPLGRGDLCSRAAG